MKWIILIRVIGFFFSDRKSEPIKLVKIVHSPPSKLSYTWAMYYKFNK